MSEIDAALLSEKEILLSSTSMSEMYTSLEDAKEEIWRRWNDRELRKKVELFLHGDIPDFLSEAPKAYLAKHIVSPNFNFFCYLESAKKINLELAMPEYRNDKFVSSNKDKYHLGKMFFSSDNRGKRGGIQLVTRSVLDFKLSDGKKFREIRTVQGGEFINFHHQLTESLVPGSTKRIFDVSEWIERNGSSPKNFYLHFFALFICNAVLFENFISKKGGYDEFNRQIVIPNFNKIRDIFGVKPLIVQTVPSEIECDPFLWYYPKEAEKIIDTFLS